MRHKHYAPLISYTPKEEIEICEHCPYDDCIEKYKKGCDYYKNKKRLLQEKIKEG